MPILGIVASGANVSSTAFESIASTTLGSDTASVTFSTISGTYQHLQLRIMTRSDRAANNDGILVQFNSNTSSIYDTHYLFGDGSTASASASTGNTAYVFQEAIPAASLNANYFGGMIIDIHDYAKTSKNTTAKTFYGFDSNNTEGKIYLASGGFRDTTAITSITLLPQNGTNFKSNSVFALYGIKGA